MRKDHYYQLQLDTLAKVKELAIKPKLLIHSCCAPCNCYPMLYLYEYFDLTLYFNNDNIYPYQEYKMRLDELIRYTKQFNIDHKTDIKIVITDYDNVNFTKKLSIYKDLPELSERCWLCYRLRLEQAYQYADDNHYDYFTTVMTISRHKNVVKLNEIGKELAEQHPNVKYFYSDLKKGGGSDQAACLLKSLDLYRQQYCGCIYSYKEMLERKTEKKD